jgi:hypothetical protein
MNFNEASDLAHQGKKIQRQGWADVAVGFGDRGVLWIEMVEDPDTPPYAALMLSIRGTVRQLPRYSATESDKSATDWQLKE